MAVSTSPGPERGLEQVAEEIVGRDGAAPLRAGDLHLAAEREQAGRQLGGRIGERDRAAERAAVADRRMADMRHGARDQRRVLRDDRRAFGRGVAHQGADLHAAVAARDAVETGNAVDVHQEARRVEPHVERGDQALAARQHARPVAARRAARSHGRASGPSHRRTPPVSPHPPLTSRIRGSCRAIICWRPLKAARAHPRIHQDGSDDGLPARSRQ